MSDSDDLKAHEEMWNNFVRLLGYSCAAITVTLLLMALFLL